MPASPKRITNGDVLVGVILRSTDWSEGLTFLTEPEAYIQVGTWWYQDGRELAAHRHIKNPRDTDLTQEAIVVMSGGVRVDFYDHEDVCTHSEVLDAGDLAIMLTGGHGYEILEPDTKIIEFKNGPFVSVERDKQRIDRGP